MTMTNLSSKKNFYSAVEAKTKELLGSQYNVTVQTVRKNNNSNYTALVIKEKNSNYGPCFSLDEYYGKYEQDCPISVLVDSIIDTYKKITMTTQMFDTTQITDFNNAKGKIVARLINRKMNEDLLKEIPHKEYLDLAIIYKIVIKEGRAEGTTTVTNHMMEQWGIDKEELDYIAMENTQHHMPHKIVDMLTMQLHLLEEMLPSDEYQKVKEYLCSDEALLQMLVVTNENHCNAAISILYEGVLEELSDYFQSDILLIPSSVHDWIAVSLNNECEEEQIAESASMINSVNIISVHPMNVLSDHPYIYRREKKTLEIA